MAEKYYRTVLAVEVLSDHPVEFESLADVSEAITTGDCSGKWEVTEQEEVSAERVAELLQAQGSDPSFLLGEPEDDEDDDDAEV